MGGKEISSDKWTVDGKQARQLSPLLQRQTRKRKSNIKPVEEQENLNKISSERWLKMADGKSVDYCNSTWKKIQRKEKEIMWRISVKGNRLEGTWPRSTEQRSTEQRSDQLRLQGQKGRQQNTCWSSSKERRCTNYKTMCTCWHSTFLPKCYQKSKKVIKLIKWFIREWRDNIELIVKRVTLFKSIANFCYERSK